MVLPPTLPTSKNNTTLIGSVIASSDKAVAEGLNKLSTGTLVTQDIKNSASYSANQIAVGGGASKDAGTSLASSGGFSANLPTVVAASGNSSSTTQSAISGGTIIIRDEEGQRALTGKTVAETIAALNRDTSDTLNTLKPIFDKEKIEAGFEIASETNRQLGQFLTNRAREIQAAKQRSDDPRLSYAERIQAAGVCRSGRQMGGQRNVQPVGHHHPGRGEWQRNGRHRSVRSGGHRKLPADAGRCADQRVEP